MAGPVRLSRARRSPTSLWNWDRDFPRVPVKGRPRYFAEAADVVFERRVNPSGVTAGGQGMTDVIAVRPTPSLAEKLTKGYQVIPCPRRGGRIIKHAPVVRFGSIAIDSARVDVQRDHMQKPTDFPQLLFARRRSACLLGKRVPQMDQQHFQCPSLPRVLRDLIERQSLPMAREPGNHVP